MRHPDRLRVRGLTALLCLVLATVALGGFARPAPAPTRAAEAVRSVTSDAALPSEFRDIRPAGIDGEAPPIPPSELWPAQ